jgi:type IV secretion system protein VirB4
MRPRRQRSGFGPGFHVYQYLLKTNRPEIPFARYADPVVEAANDQRRKLFEAKRDSLFQVEIFYVVLIEGARSKQGVAAALARFAHDPAGAMNELNAQFIGNRMKILLRSQIQADLARLEQRVGGFVRQLADFVQITVLDQQGQFTFLRRLLNYDTWRIAGSPQSTQFLDYQVVNSNVEAERDHLRVGDHVVRVLTMKEAIAETRPLVLDALLKIPANFTVCTEWVPFAADKARKEVTKRRRHFNISKTGFVSQMGNDPAKTNPRDVLVDESKQADIENLGDCLRALGDGQSLGDFSLTIVLYGGSKQMLDHLAGEFASVFTNADGNLFVETYNQLNAYFATIPGNYALNLRRLYLLNSNYADLSFLFTILPGEKHNSYLNAEYLAVLETDNSTPYYLNLHNGEVAHTLILGMTGSGKSYLANFVLQNAQKYTPQTYVFDIGGSFRSLTTIFGGSYLNVGQDDLGAAHDHVIVYAKSLDRVRLNKSTISESQRKNFKNPDKDQNGPWASTDFTAQGFRKNQMYTITTPSGAEYEPPEGRCWANIEPEFLKLQKEGRIWFGAKDSARPRVKNYLSEVDGIRSWTWWQTAKSVTTRRPRRKSTICLARRMLLIPQNRSACSSALFN